MGNRVVGEICIINFPHKPEYGGDFNKGPIVFIYEGVCPFDTKRVFVFLATPRKA